MKKQVIFLSILLAVFLGIIGYACFVLFTMDTEPEIPVEFESYKEFQDEVSTSSDEDNGLVYLDFDLDELLRLNDKFDSWLLIPDTEISFPVVRTTDNFYYLDYDFKKQSSIFGCLYYDIQSFPGSQNRVIHGHNMGPNRKEMFSTLVEYQKQEFAQLHKYAYLAYSPEVPADIYEVFAVVNFDLAVYPSYDYARANFANEAEKTEFIQFMQQKSIYKTEFVPEEELLILSTCNRQYGQSNRLLICLGKNSEAKTVGGLIDTLPTASTEETVAAAD